MSCCTYWGCRQVKVLESQSSSLCTRCPWNGALQVHIGWSEEVWFLVSVCAVQYICERIITPPRKFNPNSEPRDKDCDCSHVDSQTTVEIFLSHLLIKNKPLRESQYNFTLTLLELGLQMTLKDTATKAILTGLRFCLSPSESHLSKAWFTYFWRIFVADFILWLFPGILYQSIEKNKMLPLFPSWLPTFSLF